MKGSKNMTSIKIFMIPRFLFYLALPIFAITVMWIFIDHVTAAEFQARTESNCTIGMAKGGTKAECRVPILNGCTVAQFPAYDEPWAEASKGGATFCQFDEEKTDWKTSIVGTCEACKTDHCTGRFTVMFNCADNIPPANPAFPQQK